jgi:D-alanyl-D-alanine endopeptidase (penicillin-binding protein 7)
MVVLGMAVAPVTAQSASQSKKKPAVAKAVPAKKTSIQKKGPRRKPVARAVFRPSEGMRAGLHRTDDPLDLRSSVALVVNQDTNEVLFEKNPDAVLPIASITKLMTALVTVEAGQSMDEELTVSVQDRTADGMRSNLRPGLTLTRSQALHLALMNSENRAAHLLGRTYPGGMEAFVEAMNAKAQLLGMHDSRFVEPTGLSADNRSTPADLVRLVKAAYEHDLIREYSTSTGMELPVGKRLVRYGNTNRLTAHSDWEIGLQKTGTTSAAGRCLVMQAAIEGQRVVMILLDSVGKYSRLADAQRIRSWLEPQLARAAADSPPKAKEPRSAM